MKGLGDGAKPRLHASTSDSLRANHIYFLAVGGRMPFRRRYIAAVA